MGGLGCVVGGCPHGRILVSFCIHSERSVKTLSPPSTLPGYTDKIQRGNCCSTKCRISLRPLFALPDNNDCGHTESIHTKDDDVNEGTPAQLELTGWRLVTGNSGIVSSCLVGLLTGVAVVLFNNLVHEIRDLFWGGIPDQGASWLREQPIQATWTRVILIPAFGGMNVAMLNLLLQRLASAGEDPLLGNSAYLKSASQPILKAMAACITLGTGNSLGPEGPSVNIGTSIAKAVGFFFDKSSSRMLSLLAAGSAAGLSSGFNAAVAGCFFAVESVLWPSPIDVSISLTNTTSMVILSAVIASVVSEVGLGSEPAFKVPEYDFRSIGATGMAYGKFIGYIAAEFNPKIHLSVLEVASPQAYGLVGMAATLAGVCQVPLTAVLLLFELTQDYQIVLPLLGAVGLSSWISSVETKKGDDRGTVEHKFINSDLIILPEKSPRSSIGSSINCAIAESVPNTSNSCQVESLLCVEDDIVETTHLRRKTLVSQAMKTRYVTASMGIRLTEVLSLMLAEKQSCAVIVGTDHTLIGLLTLRDIRENSKFAKTRSKKPKELLVSELCLLGGGICNVPWTATPDMDLLSAQKAMKKHGVNQVPVVEKLCERAYPVGVLDSDSISLTCSALATKESLA
ncbi:chloride channel protein CLC-e isoform X2 [Prosopis cineraria]|uniref:chloride channel protein CLC-e isoform X2 n=1 Tax=Prosopis cineraria TaxID=364024 RepID=UPI00240ED9B9|nr:chloride channel protein CLC-e isoform X2 [Prosopis cineraria]